ncbi:sensor histidine kinase [Maribrevibacterium harenarium]|nr:sensor histidine kinase [Maribrevibacterium harenarium]
MSGFIKEFVTTLVICALIASFTNFTNDEGYWINLRIGLAFGLSIILIVNLVYLLPWSIPSWLRNTIGLIGGFVIGMAHLLSVMLPAWSWQSLDAYWGMILFNLVFSFVICSVVFYLFLSTYRVQKLRREVAEQVAQTARKDQQLALSELKLLQSQIEPHFLFNTLANMQGLVDTEPKQAKQMIQSLAMMLRVSLQRSRSQQGTLEQEFNLIRHYLDIQAIRLGERLEYTIELPEEIAQCACPPLLLQPLVENALVHGIEPSSAGGKVRLQAQIVGDFIQLDINNTGTGFGASKITGHGVGLSNVRERLHLLFGEQASLQIKPLTEQAGTQVLIKMPRSLVQ